MEALAYALIVFVATLGPIAAVPAFAAATAADPPGVRRTLALKAAALSAVLFGAVALVALGLRARWGMPAQAISIAAGTVLLLAALQLVFGAPKAAPEASGEAGASWKRALSPVVLPSILTPAGVAAILLFLAAHEEFGVPGRDDSFRWGVAALLVLTLLLNLAGLLAAQHIVRWVTPAGFRFAGWVFAILQAAIAVEAIVMPIGDTLGGPPPMTLPPDAAEIESAPMYDYAIERGPVDDRAVPAHSAFRRPS